MGQDTEGPAWLMKATWVRLLKRAKGGRVKSSDDCVSRLLIVFMLFFCVSVFFPRGYGSAW